MISDSDSFSTTSDINPEHFAWTTRPHASVIPSAIPFWFLFLEHFMRVIFSFVSGRGRPTLDWPTRLKIALGSAKGLAYLHEDCELTAIATYYALSFLFCFWMDGQVASLY